MNDPNMIDESHPYFSQLRDLIRAHEAIDLLTQLSMRKAGATVDEVTSVVSSAHMQGMCQIIARMVSVVGGKAPEEQRLDAMEKAIPMLVAGMRRILFDELAIYDAKIEQNMANKK